VKKRPSKLKSASQWLAITIVATLSWLVLAVFLNVRYINEYNKDQNLVTYGVKTTATITEVIADRCGRATCHDVYYTYRDTSGRLQAGRYSYSSRQPTATVEVYFLASDPTDQVPVGQAHPLPAVIFIFVITFGLAILFTVMTYNAAIDFKKASKKAMVTP
jgi:hypothetical protein